MRSTAPQSATTKTTHRPPNHPSSTIMIRCRSNNRPPHAFGPPATMRASWLGRETSRPAYPRKNAHLLLEGRPPDPSFSRRACRLDHSPPHFPLHHPPSSPNPRTPSRHHDLPSVQTNLSTINRPADLAPPPRPSQPIPSPHPSLARMSTSPHQPSSLVLPSLQ
jgi:hypothetical protein